MLHEALFSLTTFALNIACEKWMHTRLIKNVVLASLQNQKRDWRLNLKKSKRLGEVGAK